MAYYDKEGVTGEPQYNLKLANREKIAQSCQWINQVGSGYLPFRTYRRQNHWNKNQSMTHSCKIECAKEEQRAG